MKAHLHKQTVSQALKKIIKAIPSRSPLPILQYFCIEADMASQTMTFRATDLDFGVSCKINASIEEAGKICVLAKTLTELVSQLPGDIISFGLANNNLQVIAGNSRYSLLTRDFDEYPIFPVPDDYENRIELSESEFYNAIKKTMISVANQEEQRVVLTGMLIENTTDNPYIFDFVCTDGRSLTKTQIRLKEEKNEITQLFSSIISSRAIIEFISMLNVNSEKKIELNFSKSNLYAEFENQTGKFTTFCRFIEGKFPNYKAVLYGINNPAKTALVHKKELQNAIRRMLLTAIDKESPDLIKVNIKKDKIEMLSSSIDAGDGTELIEFVESDLNRTEKDDLILAFNGRYVNEVLSVCDSECVLLQISGENSPILISEMDKKNETKKDETMFLVMPVRVKTKNAE